MKNVQNIIIFAKNGRKTALVARIVKSYKNKYAFRKWRVMEMHYLCSVKNKQSTK